MENFFKHKDRKCNCEPIKFEIDGDINDYKENGLSIEDIYHYKYNTDTTLKSLPRNKYDQSKFNDYEIPHFFEKVKGYFG